MKKSFVLYSDTRPMFDELENDEAGQLIRAIFAINAGESPEVAKTIKPLLAVFVAQFKRDNERYSKICEQRKEYGRAGGLKRQENSFKRLSKSSKTKQTLANPSKSSKTKQTLANLADRDRDRDSIINNTAHLKCAKCVSCFDFAQFWDAYGLKRDRAKCEKKYNHISEADREKIKEVLPGYVQKTHTDGTFPSRKYPSTWLNGACWNDEEEQTAITKYSELTDFTNLSAEEIYK